MLNMEPLLWGLASAICWGVADMFGRSASMRVGSPTVAWAIQGMGALPALAGVLVFGSPWGSLATADYAALAVSVAALFSVGYIVFYRGLARGLVSIVSPVSAGYVVVTALLSAVFLHETIGIDRWALILVILAGIALASTRGRSRATLSGVAHGLTAMLVGGIAFTLWKPMVDVAGPVPRGGLGSGHLCRNAGGLPGGDEDAVVALPQRRGDARGGCRSPGLARIHRLQLGNREESYLADHTRRGRIPRGHCGAGVGAAEGAAGETAGGGDRDRAGRRGCLQRGGLSRCRLSFARAWPGV